MVSSINSWRSKKSTPVPGTAYTNMYISKEQKQGIEKANMAEKKEEKESRPIVFLYSSENTPLQYRRMRDVFPTPPLPTIMTLIVTERMKIKEEQDRKCAKKETKNKIDPNHFAKQIISIEYRQKGEERKKKKKQINEKKK